MRRGRTGVTSSDKFPNFLSGAIGQQAADDFIAITIFTPIPRLKSIGARATVMELLWVDVELDSQWSTGDAETIFQMTLGASPPASLRWSDPRVFVTMKILAQEITAGTSGRSLAVVDQIRRFDMQSQDGFGYLLASDTFNVLFRTENTGRVNQAFWKMYYRFVDIPLAEFVGIVQSTQQS